MKIIRITKDVLDMDKTTIREIYDLDTKDKDSEIYRILVPIVPNSNALTNLVGTFVESKNNVNSMDSKYSFHSANHDIVSTVKDAIMVGKIIEYKEFNMPVAE